MGILDQPRGVVLVRASSKTGPDFSSPHGNLLTRMLRQVLRQSDRYQQTPRVFVLVPVGRPIERLHEGFVEPLDQPTARRPAAARDLRRRATVLAAEHWEQ